MKMFLTLLFTTLMTAIAPAAEQDTRCFELRTYYAAEGKLDELHARFRDHTCKLFEKHGMVNIGYWIPVEAKDQDKLYYVLKHASRDAAKASWTAFGSDPVWKAARDASEVAGKIVAKVDSVYLAATDYNPALPALTGGHVYELRTYVTNESKLDALDSRFRDHTMALFAKHGMTNVLYTHPTDADKGAGKTLVYFLAHASMDAAKKSFDVV